jgi:CRP-like cAMP-binding protein
MENQLPDRNYLIESLKTKSPDGLALASGFVRQIFPISDKTAKALDACAFQCRVPKGKYIVKAGQVCPYLFLVTKGMLRGYIKDGHRELTTWIVAEGEVVSSISSFFNQVPSLENVQVLEDCVLVGIYHHDLETLYEQHSEMNIVARLLLQNYYRIAEERAYISRLAKASDRFHFFLNKRPDLASRLSLKIIASHLGVTLETLSRLRSALAKNSAENGNKV